MPHGHGLVQQSMNLTSVALGTLAGKTAIILDSSLSSIDTSFLMKRVRYLLQLVGRTADDDGPILVGIANGNATIGEIATAMQEANIAGPEDVTQSLTQDNAWVVYQNTVIALANLGSVTEAQPRDSSWIGFGGKNGIPALENSGFSLFAFNAGSGGLTTGSSINGMAQVQGVWLRA